MGLVFLLLLASISLAGQQSPSAPANTPATQPATPTAPAAQAQQDDSQAKPPNAAPNVPDANPNQSHKELSHEEKTGTSKDRLFYALPNFLTVETKQLPPLTTGQKFKVVARGSFDYIQIPWYGFLSGISQAENSESGYGQGAEGYGKRFGAYFADGTIENFMTGAILPSILKQDPRYYQSGQGGFKRRTKYAISRIFITRQDSGRNVFNASEVLGSCASSFISTYSYHPSEDKTVPNTMSVWGTQVGYDTLTLVVKEFWPDIRRMISKKRASGK
jgi:hypothetical protein